MWEDQQVTVHGDATPSNFLFGDKLTVTAIDLERMKSTGRVFDVGRVAGELQHFFETDEGMEEIYRGIRHFLTYQGIYLYQRDIREPYFRIMNEQLEASQEAFPQFDVVAIWDSILARHVSDYTRALPPEKRRQLPVISDPGPFSSHLWHCQTAAERSLRS